MTSENPTPADAPADKPEREPAVTDEHTPADRPALPDTGEHLALPGPEEHAALPEHAEPAPVAEAHHATPVEPVPTAEPEPEAAPAAEPEPQPVEAELPAEEPAPEEPAAPEEPLPDPVAEEPAPEEAVAEPEFEAEPEPDEQPDAATPTKSAARPAAEPETAEAVGSPAAPVADSNKKWYVVKVQSGREESIKAAIERKVRIEGLEEFFGRIEIPVEEIVEKKKVKAKVKDKKTGEVETVTQEKNVVKRKKKFPGYLFAEVEFNENILYLFRETAGVGDFVGASQHRAPAPMPDHEVQSMLTGVVAKGDRKAGKVKVKLDFEKGDRVKIKDGAFAGSEGEVLAITEPKDPADTPKVTVVVTFWGRPVQLEDLDYWHVDKV